MRFLNFQKATFLSIIIAFFAMFIQSDVNAQWEEDTANGEITTDTDRVRIVGPESTSLDNFAGAKLFVQNPSVSPNNALRVWQERENHSAVHIGTNGYGLKLSSTTATPNSRWLMHMDHNGSEIFTVKADGRVGIGKAFPSGKFQVDHSGITHFIVQENGRVGVGTATPGAKMNIVNANQTGVPALLVRQLESRNSACNLTTNGYGLYVKSTHSSSKYLMRLYNSGGTAVLTAHANGQVGIGTTVIPSGYKLKVNGQATMNGLGVGTSDIPAGYKLAVDGKVIAEEVKVQMSDFWDDVFETETYDLMPLEEKEDYTQTNKHLPSFAPEAEIVAEGMEIGEGIANTVKELEEAYLYIYQLNDLLKKQQTQIEELSVKVNELSK